MKRNGIKHEETKMQMLCFMMLCGTDYNVIPKVLSIKRLLNGWVLRSELFCQWCKSMRNVLLKNDSETFNQEECHELCRRLATFTGVPKTTQVKHWIMDACEAMCKTTKYMYKRWNLTSPLSRP
ncbi:hypothetical protein CRENBAI_010178, partial [Crenichthys baileyi]